MTIELLIMVFFKEPYPDSFRECYVLAHKSIISLFTLIM